VKILLTVHQFFPDYTSGTEVLTFSVAKELIRRGHTVAVITAFPTSADVTDADRYDEHHLDGMHVYRFHHAYIPMGGQNSVAELEYDNHLAARYFESVLREFKPNVVHFFHMLRLSSRIIDVTVKAGIPAYYTPTDFWSICPTAQLLLPNGKVCSGPSIAAGNCVKHFAEMRPGSRAQRIAPHVPNFVAEAIVVLVNKNLLPEHRISPDIRAMSKRKNFLITRINWLDGIISPTHFMTKTLIDNGVDRRLMLESAYGIDVSEHAVTAPSLEPGELLTIGFIGTLAPHKGCHVLIEAFKLLPPGTARLKIYGNLKDFAEYNAGLLGRAQGREDIEFCGTFPNSDIGKVLEGLHVLVVPSVWFENAPLVVYSALAAKRPVIASDFPGLSENVKDDVNGMIFRPGDFTALHAKLHRLVSDPGLLARLSSNCRPPKSTPTYVEELLAVYAASPRTALAPEMRPARNLPDMTLWNKPGVMRGWAAVGFKGPARIGVRIGGATVGETRIFMSRPDVHATLDPKKEKSKSNAFGYTIVLPGNIDRRAAEIFCEGHDGKALVLPLSAIAANETITLGKGDFIAIDSEQFIWQDVGEGFLFGWASAGYAPPARVALRLDGKVLGETAHFQSREDVRNLLMVEGHEPAVDSYGFTLSAPDGIDRNAAEIYCEAQDGRTFVVTLRDVPVEKMTGSGGNYVAIDKERMRWRGNLGFSAMNEGLGLGRVGEPT
jgi:glycosyltransferase involved in cell wall biosynthesis